MKGWLRAFGWASVAIAAGIIAALLAVAVGDRRPPAHATWSDPWGWK